MRIKDEYVRGVLAGMFGGLASLIVNGGSRLLGISEVMWLELMGLIILGRFPNTVAQYIFSLAIQLTFLGIIGGIFALILPLISTEHIYFKGASYGAAIWFALFSLPHLLKFSELKEVPLLTALVNVSASLAWGIALAFFLKLLRLKLYE